MALAEEKQAAHNQNQNLFLGKHNITTGLFLSGKKGTYASFSKGPSQLFTKDCRGYKSRAQGPGLGELDQHQQL